MEFKLVRREWNGEGQRLANNSRYGLKATDLIRLTSHEPSAEERGRSKKGAIKKLRAD